MKKIFCLFCFYIPGVIILFSQNYSPFNGNVTKRFYNVDNIADNNYFYYSDQTDTVINSVFFHQYHNYQTAPVDFNPDPCFGWGGGIWAVADTTWLGNLIVYDISTQELKLFNQDSDTIKFDFGLALNDSAIFYQDSMNKYYIRFDQIQSESIYGNSDTIKTFTILHLDSGNVVVSSPIHEASVKLGKNLGLIGFIDAYNFPVMETVVALKGQIYPLIGSYQLTYDELYPFQIGDTLQFNGYQNSFWAGSDCSYVSSYAVTGRNETPTNVTIMLNHSTQWLYKYPPDPWNNCSNFGPYSTTISFAKDIDILGIPFDHIQPYGPYNVLNGSTTVDWPLGCINVGSFIRDESASVYCDSCKCYIDADGNGSYFTDYYYTPGFGVTRIYQWLYSMDYAEHTLSLRYYKIDGLSCGNAFNIGIEETDEKSFKIYPNPFSSTVFISSEPDEIWIYDINGTVLQKFINPGTSIDLSKLVPGLYIMCIKMDNHLYYEKISKVDE